MIIHIHVFGCKGVNSLPCTLSTYRSAHMHFSSLVDAIRCYNTWFYYKLSRLPGAHNEKERLMFNTVREPTFRTSMPK